MSPNRLRNDTQVADPARSLSQRQDQAVGFIKPSPAPETGGCLGTMIGGALGFWYNSAAFSHAVAEELAADPDAHVCGLPFLAGAVVFGVLGMVTGCLVGVIAGYLVRRSRRRPDVRT
jgi:hypothetical protein